jgi:heat shock protein HslJ
VPPAGRWVLTSFREATVLPGSEITLEITEGEFAGHSGVNRFFGKIEGDRFVSPIATTMMAGPPELMHQERKFLKTIAETDSWAVNENRLVLRAGDEAVAVFERLEGRLAGQTWVVVGYNNGTGGFTSPMAGTEITASFTEDGRMVGSGGCNRFHAQYGVENERISIEPPASTRMNCPDESVMRQEIRFLELLAEADYLEFGRQQGRDMLELFSGDGLRLVQLVAADSDGTENFDETSN